MEASKGSISEKEKFGHLRNREGSIHIFLWLPEALPKRFGPKKLCPQPQLF